MSAVEDHQDMLTAIRQRMADPAAPVLEALLAVVDMHSRTETVNDDDYAFSVCVECGFPAEQCSTLDLIAGALDMEEVS